MIKFLVSLTVIIIALKLIYNWVMKRLDEIQDEELEDSVQEAIKNLDNLQRIADTVNVEKEKSSFRKKEKNSKTVETFLKESK